MAEKNAVELAQHLFAVLSGSEPALDNKSSQPVGMTALKSPDSFLIPLLQISVMVWLFISLVSATGRGLARLSGLRGGIVERFAASFVELTYYSLSLSVMAKVCWYADWFWPSGWGNLMMDGRNQSIKGLKPYTTSADMKFLYLVETGFYIVALIKLLTAKRKKDFWQMFFHHIVTGVLLLVSYTAGYIRIGAVVMFLHNLFDPFLHLAKCCNYAKVPILPDVAFVACMITFAVSRLYYYPICIWHSFTQVCNNTKTCPGGVWDKEIVESSLIFLLTALLPVHIFWFFLILKVLKKAVLKGSAEGDVRSDSEDEEEEEQLKKKK